MAIRVPKPISYYYEIAPPYTRLVVCFPRSVLEDRVRAGEAKKEILEHYPDGLDFQVCEYEIEYYRKNYGLKLALDPDRLRAALEAVRAKAHKEKKEFRPTGFLRAEELDSIADLMADKLPPKEPGVKKEKMTPAEWLAAQRRQREQRQSFLKKPGEELDKKLLLHVLMLSEKEMTEGEEAAQAFLRIQKRISKGGG